MSFPISYIICTKFDVAKTSIAPIKYGNIVFLYSAFSSTLPTTYLIPIIAKVTADTMLPINCTAPNTSPALENNFWEPPPEVGL